MSPNPVQRWGEAVLRNPKADRVLRPALREARSVRWRAGAAVNAAAEGLRRRRSGDALTTVAGNPETVTSGERVAVLAEFDRGPHVRPWALRMAGALAAAGYPCLVVASRDLAGPVQAPDDLPDGVAIVARGNVRLDFGAWAAALEAFPGLQRARHVLLTNDSIIGPLAPGHVEVRALLDRGEASGVGVFGATRGLTFSDHVQSYWLQFNGTLGLPSVRHFFATLPPTKDRTDLNRRFECALTPYLVDQGVTVGWAWDAASFGYPAHTNPSLCWRDLLDAGFPFVKRKLLSDHPRFRTARHDVVQHVRDRYGVDVA